MDSEHSFDLIVIGGGSGGYAAARQGVEKGLKVAVVESAEELGGLCILKGCMPTKSLIETANRLRAIREADEFGIQVTEPVLDIHVLRERKTRLIDGFKEYRQKGLTSGDFKLVRGSAEFIDAHSIQVHTSQGVLTLQGKTFVISTGSEESIPPIKGLQDTPFWTSDDVVDLPRVPKKVIVLGTGAVGLESAFLFHGLGSEVTILSRSKPLISGMEPEISDALVKRCEDLGIKIIFEHAVNQVSFKDDVFKLDIKNKNTEAEPSIEADCLIVAVGRKPRISALKLANAGFAPDIKRITIDKFSQTEVPHIFAAGDCASPLALVHLAVLQGEAAGANISSHLNNPEDEFTKSWDIRLKMIGIFTDPEVVQVGYTEKEAQDMGYEVAAASYYYNDQGKGEIVGEKHGLVKLIADKKTGKLLGASGMGPHVIDYSHTITVALHQKLTVDEFVSIPSYHPTLGEIWSYVAEELQDDLNEGT